MARPLYTIVPPGEGPALTVDVASDDVVLAVRQGMAAGEPYLSAWRLADGGLLGIVGTGHAPWEHRLRFLNDGQQFVHAGAMHLPVWNSHWQGDGERALLATDEHAFYHWVSCAAQAPRVCISGRHTEVWDLAEGTLLFQLRDAAPEGADHPFVVGALSPTGRSLLLSGVQAGEITLIDVDEQAPHGKLAEAPDAVSWLDVDPSGRWAVALGYNALGLYLWELETGTPRRNDTFKAEQDYYYRFRFDWKGKYLALGMLSGAVDVLDMSTQERVDRFTAHDGRIYDMAFSRDGKRLVTAGHDGAVRVWDLTKR